MNSKKILSAFEIMENGNCARKVILHTEIAVLSLAHNIVPQKVCCSSLLFCVQFCPYPILRFVSSFVFSSLFYSVGKNRCLSRCFRRASTQCPTRQNAIFLFDSVWFFFATTTPVSGIEFLFLPGRPTLRLSIQNNASTSRTP